ncbi:hypothetical protein IP84_01570 [beta proteobacterium AAP99]|nr:hypothetical protein IP84_01570 [beta proteobacterium AAP99]
MDGYAQHAPTVAPRLDPAQGQGAARSGSALLLIGITSLQTVIQGQQMPAGPAAYNAAAVGGLLTRQDHEEKHPWPCP